MVYAGGCTMHYCPVCGEEANATHEGDYNDGSHFMVECSLHCSTVVWPKDEHEDGCECYDDEEGGDDE